MKLSISAKIFLGFLVVLATFGAVALYGAMTMRHLSDELRLVSRGYVKLRLELSELQNSQSNLLRLLGDNPDRAQARPMSPFVKVALDDVRRDRLRQRLPQLSSDLLALSSVEEPQKEQELLAKLSKQLGQVQQSCRLDEELFDQVYGPVGDAPLEHDPERSRAAAVKLFRREQTIKRELSNIATELRLRAEEASLRLEAEEDRAVWGTLGATVLAVLVGLVVMLMTTRTVRPLRRLSEQARAIARGEYRQRVDDSAPDEVGLLAREFNAMAAALDEREQRLIRSERLAAVGKIAAQITHEVRNPLSSIGLNAELLEEEVSGLECEPRTKTEVQTLAHAIVKEVDRLTEITEDYLRLARLPDPKLENEQLSDLLSSLLSFMKREIADHSIRVDLALQPNLTVAADENQLRQALVNIVRNACEAMPRGGTLRVSSVGIEAGHTVELSISDTGQGIAEEHRARIFEPFFTTKKGGTGLGLALTQQIILEHGGTISVDSQVGHGTTFTVRLPNAKNSAKRMLVEGQHPLC